MKKEIVIGINREKNLHYHNVDFEVETAFIKNIIKFMCKNGGNKL